MTSVALASLFTLGTLFDRHAVLMYTYDPSTYEYTKATNETVEFPGLGVGNAIYIATTSVETKQGPAQLCGVRMALDLMSWSSPIAWEYYFRGAWETLSIMAATGENDCNTRAQSISPEERTKEYQILFSEEALGMAHASDPMGLGVEHVWVRIRVVKAEKLVISPRISRLNMGHYCMGSRKDGFPDYTVEFRSPWRENEFDKIWVAIFYERDMTGVEWFRREGDWEVVAYEDEWEASVTFSGDAMWTVGHKSPESVKPSHKDFRICYTSAAGEGDMTIKGYNYSPWGKRRYEDYARSSMICAMGVKT